MKAVPPFVVEWAINMRRGRDGVFRLAVRPHERLELTTSGAPRGVEYNYTVVDEVADADVERLLELARRGHALELRQVAGVWQLAPARQLAAGHS